MAPPLPLALRLSAHTGRGDGKRCRGPSARAQAAVCTCRMRTCRALMDPPPPRRCFDTKHTPADQMVCSTQLADTLTYTQVGGIIAGQLVSGGRAAEGERTKDRNWAPWAWIQEARGAAEGGSQGRVAVLQGVCRMAQRRCCACALAPVGARPTAAGRRQ